MVVAVLFKAGDHVPVIPLRELVGNGDKISSEHIGFTGLKVGIFFGFTTISIEALMAHCPDVGIKV